MGKKWRIILAVLLVFAVVLAIVWEPLRLGEPWYRGRPLSLWLEEYGASPQNYKPSTNADEAMRHMGSRAVPHLLALLQATNFAPTNFTAPTILTGGVVIWSNQMPAQGTVIVTNGRPVVMFLATNRIIATNLAFKARVERFIEKFTPYRFHPVKRPASWGHWHVYLAFQALGPKGKAAIPGLAQLAHDTNGSGNYPNIESMKDPDIVAGLAKSSVSDPPPLSTFIVVGSYFGGTPVNNNSDFLARGELATWSLAAIGSSSVPALMELLADPKARLKSRAAEALGMIGPDAAPAVPALVKCLDQVDPDVRARAADALGWVNARPDLAVPALIESLGDSQIGASYYAAQSLGNFREHASNSVPALLRAFGKPDYRMKEAAAVALSKISPTVTAEKVFPALREGLLEYSPQTRNSTIITLNQMRDLPDLVVPVLIEATEDQDSMIRNNAVIGLGQFGPKAKAAIPKLLTLSNDPDAYMRLKAQEAVIKISTDKSRR